MQADATKPASDRLSVAPPVERTSVESPSLPFKLTPAGGTLFLVLSICLNSLLAIFGTLLWGFFPFWPAYMLYVLAVIYFGWWGVLLAVLTPMTASLLMFDSAPVYLFVPINLTQVSLALFAFKLLRIHPALPTWTQRALYLVFVVALPSFVGGSSAYRLLNYIGHVRSEPLVEYAGMWTIENLCPAIFPGIWLHRVIGSSYAPFAWESGKVPKSWMRKSIENSAPWMLSLTAVGVLFVWLLALQTDWAHVHGLRATTSGLFKTADHVVSAVPGLRLTVLALSVLLLYALGSSIHQAKQSWVLGEAVRRHLPNRRVSELLLSGIQVKPEQCTLTVVVCGIRNFDQIAGECGPSQLVACLSSFFTRVSVVAMRRGGCVVDFGGNDILIAFGLQSAGACAEEAILSALEMHSETELLNGEHERRGLPALNHAIGVNTGLVVAGEIGSAERRQYAVLGQAVNAAGHMRGKVADLPAEVLPIVVSRETMRTAGLLRDAVKDDEGFLEFGSDLPGEDAPEPLFAFRSIAIPRVRALAQAALSRRNTAC